MKKILLLLFCMMSMTVQAQEWPASSIQTYAGTRWWWMGSAVEEKELSELMKEYSSHGIRTLEITPIYGVKGNEVNNVSFLSPRWMGILKYVEELGVRNQMQIDMNCGTGWPFGGPEVPLEEATCRVMYRVDTVQVLKQLSLDLTPDNRLKVASTTEEDGENVLQTALLQRVMAYRLDTPADTQDLTSLVQDNVLTWEPKIKEGSTWQIFSVYQARTKQRVNRAAPGGEGWVIDHFDAMAVKHYLDRFDKAFAENGTPYPDTFLTIVMRCMALIGHLASLQSLPNEEDINWKNICQNSSSTKAKIQRRY